jgi:hypothetical protein
MASLTETNYHAVKRIFCYISNTLSHGLQLQAVHLIYMLIGLAVLLLVDRFMGFAPF